MAKFNMFVTFLVLPYYWIRSQFLRRFGSERACEKEMLTYPRDYLGFRRIKIVTHGVQPDSSIPSVYVSNHQSHNDIFITIGSVNRPFRFVAKKELFTSFITGTFMKMTASYPLERDDPRQSLTILKQAVTDVQAGKSILAFPEGTRSKSVDMLPFKDGIFAMLRKAKAPIVPMYIKESFDESKGEFHVYFGEPLLPKMYESMNGSKLSEAVRQEMEKLQERAYQNESID